MPTYVALLRGVNLGGRNSVSMSALRALVEELGGKNVRTYIASGNVVFSHATPLPAAELEAEIAQKCGVQTTVMFRTAGAFAKVVAANPFPGADVSKLHVGFMARKAPAAAVPRLDGERFLPEEFAVRGTELYAHLPNGIGRTKLMTYLGQQLQIPMTVRNWNTVTKLATLACA